MGGIRDEERRRVDGKVKGQRAITQQRRSDIRGAPRCAEEANSEKDLPSVVCEGSARHGSDLRAKSEHPLGARTENAYPCRFTCTICTGTSSKQVFAVMNLNSALAEVCSAIEQLLASTLWSEGFLYLG